MSRARKIALLCSLLCSWWDIISKNWVDEMIFFMFWSNVITFKTPIVNFRCNFFNLFGFVKFLFFSNCKIFVQLCESKFYYFCVVLIYHIIYSYSLIEELSKDQSKVMKNCLIMQKCQLMLIILWCTMILPYIFIKHNYNTYVLTLTNVL
jgi:hypothetical protein